MEISDIKEGLEFNFCREPNGIPQSKIYTIRNVRSNDCMVTWDGGEDEYYLHQVLDKFKRGVWVLLNPIAQTKEQLLAQIDELQKQVEEIDKKEEENYFDLSEKSSYLVPSVRIDREWKNRGFYLNSGVNWEIVTDSEGVLVLVPTKKQ